MTDHLKMHSMNKIGEHDSIVHNSDFENIVLMIKQSQIKAYSSVNHELIDLYYNLGKYISQKVEHSKWGKGIVKELADYIEKTNPDLKGFSDKNLWRMKQFYESYKDDEKLSTVLRELSWSQNLQIFSRCKSIEERVFYEHLGQLNFYLEALDRDVKKEKENPSIGILLCRDKDDDVVEYALSRSLSPAMIAEYKLHLPNKKLLQKRITALLDNAESKDIAEDK